MNMIPARPFPPSAGALRPTPPPPSPMVGTRPFVVCCGSGFRSAWNASPPTPLCLGLLVVFDTPVVWCGSGLGLLGLRYGVVRGMRLLLGGGGGVIIIIILIIIMMLLSWINCHRNRAHFQYPHVGVVVGKCALSQGLVVFGTRLSWRLTVWSRHVHSHKGFGMCGRAGWRRDTRG